MDRRIVYVTVLLLLTGLLLAALPLAAFAADRGSIAAALYGHEDTDTTDSVPNRGSDPRGYHVSGVLPMPTRPIAYFAEYGHTDVLEQFSVGFQLERPFWFSLDLTAAATVEYEDMTDERGYGGRAGLRWRPFGPWLELRPELRHENLFEPTTSGRLTAALELQRGLHAETALQLGEDERYLVGLRYGLSRL